ncbi:MAG: LacI family DNA-binding transcriptional regulator [Clostridiales Family XIII bacterium]|jgi:ribose transport system substrate-binding protein|nr:LacI family DNA-binding transcriptional regulator [Clostridiales Family XIII bacterium]
MGVTINDIARRAGVSIATVSHVLNKTRYVSPDLTERVEKIVGDTGYRAGDAAKLPGGRIGKLSEIAYVIPKMDSALYSRLGAELTRLFSDEGYSLCTYVTDDNFYSEKNILTNLLSNRRIAGLVLVPAMTNVKSYRKLMNSGLPFVCLERVIDDDGVDCVLADSETAIFYGTSHLIKNGHERIALIAGTKNRLYTDSRVEGYKKALHGHGLQYDKSLVFHVGPKESVERDIFSGILGDAFPTAFVAAGNALTVQLLKAVHDMGYEYPHDLSIIGYGDDSWCDVTTPPLTTLRQNAEKMAYTASSLLISKIRGEKIRASRVDVPVDLVIRESTRCIERGPHGEMAMAPEQIIPTDAEIEHLRAKGYRVGISFHYGGTEWVRLHERAIRDAMYKFGVDIASVVEAHFDPKLQIAQLDGLMMQNLDAIISLPADDRVMTRKYKELSEKTKLIFLGILPESLAGDNYCAMVSVNERENGQNAGKILGDYFKGKERVKVGMIIYGATFLAINQRDAAAEQVLLENYSNIEIVAREEFCHYEEAYDACRVMIEEHPEIEGVYVSWERPALGAIKALEEMKRADVSLATVDLDYKIASYLAKNKIVRGISAQRPYEQGEAAAIAVADALLNKSSGRFIGVRPQIVLPQNLNRFWKEIMHSDDPGFLKK